MTYSDCRRGRSAFEPATKEAIMERNHGIGIGKLVLLAGLAGGMAEILWVALYSALTATSAAAVARQVAASIWPAAGQWAFAPALGILIHLALAVALAAALVPLLARFAARPPRRGAIVAGATAALVLVWAVNFFVVLPLLDPAFVKLMPYAVTLASKALFGLTLGWVLLQRVPARARTRDVSADRR